YCAGPTMRKGFEELSRIMPRGGSIGLFDTHPSLTERWKSAGNDCAPTSTLELAKAGLPSWKLGYQWEYSWKGPQGAGGTTREIIREEVFDGVPSFVMK